MNTSNVNMINSNNTYLSTISAQIQCINELLLGVKKERLFLNRIESDYQIEKIPTEASQPCHSTILFQGKGRDCHLFLNGYMAFFFTD